MQAKLIDTLASDSEIMKQWLSFPKFTAFPLVQDLSVHVLVSRTKTRSIVGPCPSQIVVLKQMCIKKSLRC